MVKAPDGWEPGQPVPPPRVEPPAGATAIVEMKRKDDTSSDADFDAIDDILANAPHKPKQPVVTVAADAPGLARARFAGNPPPATGSGSSVGKGGTPAPGTSAVAAAGANAAVATSSTAEPSVVKGRKPAQADRGSKPDIASIPDFRPPPTRTWSLWMAVSVLAGIALAIAVVVASASFFRGEPKQAAQASNPAPQPSPGHQTVASAAGGFDFDSSRQYGCDGAGRTPAAP